jgi:hypothetical protein
MVKADELRPAEAVHGGVKRLALIGQAHGCVCPVSTKTLLASRLAISWAVIWRASRSTVIRITLPALAQANPRAPRRRAHSWGPATGAGRAPGRGRARPRPPRPHSSNRSPSVMTGPSAIRRSDKMTVRVLVAERGGWLARIRAGKGGADHGLPSAKVGGRGEHFIGRGDHPRIHLIGALGLNEGGDFRHRIHVGGLDKALRTMPKPAWPGRPALGAPEAALSSRRLSPICSRPASLGKVTSSSWPTTCGWAGRRAGPAPGLAD